MGGMDRLKDHLAAQLREHWGKQLHEQLQATLQEEFKLHAKEATRPLSCAPLVIPAREEHKTRDMTPSVSTLTERCQLAESAWSTESARVATLVLGRVNDSEPARERPRP